jgi:sec-independent protein translocase protein TatA
MEFFSPGHLVIIAIVALVLFFGWKQLPDMARSMGRSMRIFKTEIKGMTEDDKVRAAKDAEVQPKAIQAAPVVQAPVVPAVPMVKTPAVQAPAVVQAPALQAPAVGARPRPTPSPNGRHHEASAESPNG